MEKKTYFENTKTIIDQTIHKYLYVLIKYIFLGETNIKNKSKKYLVKFTEQIKKKYKNKYEISLGRNIYNLKIILKYAKSQNYLFIREIIENIIIRVFSFAFKAESSEFFGKYIYNNLKNLLKNKTIFTKWIISNKIEIFKESELKEIIFYSKNLEKDNSDKNSSESKDLININNNLNNTKESENNKSIDNNPYIQLLSEICHLRRDFAFKKQKNNDENKKSFSDTNSNSKTTIYSKKSDLYYGSNLNKELKKSSDYFLPYPLSIFISVYIYYKNNRSPLIDYSKDSENLTNLNFSYQLSEAGINDYYLPTIIRPIRLEPKIEIIELDKNRFEYNGIFELHKSIIFNGGIKKISVRSCGIKSIYLYSFSENFKLFKNNYIEELDMSSNYLNSDADTYLSELISILKNLKILCLSYNNLKSGIASLFVTLKNLYRQKKSKLETLILIKCQLDDIAFYELGELLKSKYCKLKCLCISENIIPSNINFFKSLKLNRSLQEIYLYGCGINSDKADEIDRIISNSNLESLSLNANPLHDFNQCIRIIYRNCLIKNNEEIGKENLFYDFPCLYDLSMNKTDCFNRNIEKIKLFKKGTDRTNLSCLDFTEGLFGYNIYNIGCKNYKGEIDKIVEDLKNKQEDYKKALCELLENEIDKKKLNKKLEEKYLKKFSNLEDEIENIINNEKSRSYLFIKKRASELKSKVHFNDEEDEKNKLEKLTDYIFLKRAEMVIKKNEDKKNNKKMILI